MVTVVDKPDISAVCNIPQVISISELNRATNKNKNFDGTTFVGVGVWEALSRKMHNKEWRVCVAGNFPHLI
jgi:hypothetical protein